ncbi:MAG: cell division septal protein [Ignavibacteria bacterium]|nr:cell division septal protein [Ignavibacteria bacterium]
MSCGEFICVSFISNKTNSIITVNVGNIEPEKNSTKSRAMLFWFFVTVLFVSGIIYYARKWNSSQLIQTVTVDGTRLVAAKEIIERAMEKISGKKPDAVELNDIRQNIKSHPYISNVTVQRKSPKEIKISIIERKPCAIIADSAGNLSFIDAGGVFLPYKIMADMPDLPIIRGLTTNKKEFTSPLFDALSIITTLQNDDFTELGKEISELIYSPMNRSYTMLLNDFNITVIFGDIKNINEKLYKLKSFKVAKIFDKNMRNVRRIDLRWSEQIVVS